MDKDEMITLADGGCDFDANGLDCRDCPFAGTCDHYRNYDD